MDFKTVSLVLLGLYLLVMFGIGLYGKKHAESFSDWMDAGKKATFIMVIGSALGNHIGGGYVLGITEQGAQLGIGGVWLGISYGFAYIFFSMVAKIARRMSCVTVAEVLAKRYGGKRTQLFFAALNSIGYTGLVASQIVAGGTILRGLGIDPEIALIATTLVVFFYSMTAGLWGEMMTDIIQVLVIGGFLIVAAGYLLIHNSTAPLVQLTQANPSALSLMPYTLKDFLLLVVPTTLFGFVSQVSYQRTRAAENDKIAVSHHWIAGLVLIALSFAPALMGMYGRTLFPDMDAKLILNAVTLNALPLVIGSVMVIGLFAAIMSTADSLFIGVVAHLLNDIYKNVAQGDVSDVFLRKAKNICMGAIAAIALIMAFTGEGLIPMLILAYSIVVCGAVVAVLGGLLWKNATEAGAFWSMVVGSGTFLLGKYGILPIPYPNLVALIPSLAVFIIVSIMTSSKANPQWLEQLEQNNKAI